MAARGLRHTAVSMNELNSHCSDAVYHDGHRSVRFPAPRSSLFARLIILICAASRSFIELYPPLSGTTLPCCLVSIITSISLRTRRFPAFFTSIHFVRREL